MRKTIYRNVRTQHGVRCALTVRETVYPVSKLERLRMSEFPAALPWVKSGPLCRNSRRKTPAAGRSLQMNPDVHVTVK